MTLPRSDRLAAHLEVELGVWPPVAGTVTVAGSGRRTEPGWDGRVRRFAGLHTPGGSVLSVAPELVAATRELLPLWGSPAFDDALAVVLGQQDEGRRIVTDGVLYRWSTEPTPGVDVGEWVATSDPRVPAWLRPFNGGVLCAWDARGEYGAGVGIKAHDEFGHEIAVGTEPSLRGRGIARALVTTAARRILAQGALPLYIHESGNHASDHVATAAGFPDRGDRMIGFWSPRGDPVVPR